MLLAAEFKETAVEKAKPRARNNKGGHIPIELMNRLGCEVCPSDKDRNLRAPKMKPEGNPQGLVYLLSNSPTPAEDENGLWTGPAAREIMKKMPYELRAEVRYNNMVNCANGTSEHTSPDVRQIECCRGRVIKDIEETKPLVVVGVGDDPLHWATGITGSAIPFRGTLIPVRLGTHVCWYYPILYPNYTNRESKKVGEYELTLQHDLTYLDEEIANGLTFPTMMPGPYDEGIEYITGTEPGDMQRLEEALHWIIQQPRHGLDYETSAIAPLDAPDPKIWTAALGTYERTIAYPIHHEDGWGTESRMRKVLNMTGEAIYQSGRKRCHQVGFEQTWSSHFFGQRILRRTEWDDTMAMGNVLDGRPGTQGLDSRLRIRAGFFLKAQSRVDVSVNGWIKMHSLKDVLRYNGMDTKWCDWLADVELPILRDLDLFHVYEERMITAPGLVMMTERGLPIDLPFAHAMNDDIEAKLRVVEKKIKAAPEIRRYEAKKGTFEPTNSDHVLALMKAENRNEVWRTKWDGSNGKWTTDEEALAQIPPREVPSAPLILEHRGLTRNLTTYIRPLLDGKLTSTDGLLHAEYNQLRTVTSRLSSPMHNWPKHKFKEVRGCVAAPADHWFVAADEGQLEFRVAGMLSEDENIVKYSWTGYDVHGYWAQRFVDTYGPIKDFICDEYHVDWDEKGLKTLRQHVKNNWVFPQLFGSTSQACATNMHVPIEVTDDLGAEYWDEFRGAKRWQENVIRFYNENLYVETLGGFRRRGPTTVNELINMPIQGTAFELVRAAQNDISEQADAAEDPSLHPVFNGHDDLSFIIHDDNLESHIDVIARAMSKPRFPWVIVPLIVEVSVGPRWSELTEIGKYNGADLFSLPNPYR